MLLDWLFFVLTLTNMYYQYLDNPKNQRAIVGNLPVQSGEQTKFIS